MALDIVLPKRHIVVKCTECGTVFDEVCDNSHPAADSISYVWRKPLEMACGNCNKGVLFIDESALNESGVLDKPKETNKMWQEEDHGVDNV